MGAYALSACSLRARSVFLVRTEIALLGAAKIDGQCNMRVLRLIRLHYVFTPLTGLIRN